MVDTSYLELVRLDVKAADDPNIVQILDVVDSTAVVGPFSTLPQEPPEERAQSGHPER